MGALAEKAPTGAPAMGQAKLAAAVAVAQRGHCRRPLLWELVMKVSLSSPLQRLQVVMQ